MDIGLNSLDNAYQLYLESIDQQKQNLILFTQECVCLENGDIAGIHAINESVMDKIKSGLDKLLQLLAGIWRKFAEGINSVLATDLAYLKKYEDIIKNKPVLSRPITIAKYNINSINKIEIKKFTYDETMKSWLSKDEGAAEESFTDIFLSELKLPKGDLAEVLQEHLIGEEEETDATNLSIKTDYYNFCLNFKELTTKLKKDTDVIVASKAEVLRVIGQLTNEAERKEKQPEQENLDTKPEQVDSNINGISKPTNIKPSSTGQGTSNNVGGTENTQDVNASTIYSNVLGSYINESIINELNIGAASQDKKTNTTSGTGSVSKITKDDTESLSSDISNDNKASTELKALTDKIGLYFRLCNTIVAQRTSAAAKAQKDFMAVIKAHVRDYVATEKTDKAK